jgi:YbbR domain-containing protein
MFFPSEKFFQKEERQIFLNRLFRRVFLEDWLMKLVALAITLGLWLGVTGLRAPITTRLSNVELRLRVSNDIEITNSPVQEVDLVITGDKRKIDQIKQSDLVVSLDLADAQTGDRIVQISPDNVNVELPTGIRLDEVQPNKIAVKIEKVEEREITVKAETEGDLDEGFEIYSTIVAPQKVRIRAPESYIKSLDFVSTEKISIENRQEDFTEKQVALNVVNSKATLLDATVDVSFKIGERRIEKLFAIPVKADNKIKAATVVLYGARSILERVKTEDLQVEILKNEAGENVSQLTLPLEIQGKVEIRKLEIK